MQRGSTALARCADVREIPALELLYLKLMLKMEEHRVT